jgi:hypothetical protein
MSPETKKRPRAITARGVVTPSPPSSAKVSNVDDGSDGRQAKPVNPYSSAVPVEGQWERGRTPLSRRDKWLLAGLAVLVLVGAIAAAVVLATRSSSSQPAGACLVVDVPSTMGGGHLKECGAAARRFCLEEAKRDAAVAAACRKQGFLAEAKPKP